MDRKWRAITGCGITLVLLSLVRGWGEAGSATAQPPDRRVLLNLPGGEGKLLGLQADSLTSSGGELRARGEVVLYLGSVRVHVPRSVVRIVPQGEQGSGKLRRGQVHLLERPGDVGHR